MRLFWHLLFNCRKQKFKSYRKHCSLSVYLMTLAGNWYFCKIIEGHFDFFFSMVQDSICQLGRLLYLRLDLILKSIEIWSISIYFSSKGGCLLRLVTTKKVIISGRYKDGMDVTTIRLQSSTLSGQLCAICLFCSGSMQGLGILTSIHFVSTTVFTLPVELTLLVHIPNSIPLLPKFTNLFIFLVLV